jgi:hypothetical protein
LAAVTSRLGAAPGYNGGVPIAILSALALVAASPALRNTSTGTAVSAGATPTAVVHDPGALEALISSALVAPDSERHVAADVLEEPVDHGELREGQRFDRVLSNGEQTELDLVRIMSILRPGGLWAIRGRVAFDKREARRAGFGVLVFNRMDLRARGSAPSTLLVRRIEFPSCTLDRLARFRSRYAAEKHASALARYRNEIETTAHRSGVDAAVIAAIISRESGGGLLLSPAGPGGRGDRGHGHGLMQIDDSFFGEWLAANNWRTPQQNIQKGVSILLDSIAGVRALATEHALHAAEGELLAAGLSAYNASAELAVLGLENQGRADAFTKNGDYAQDVLCRAEYYRRNGFHER